MTSPQVFAALADLFMEIASILGIKGSRCTYTFPAEFEEVLSCPSSAISVERIDGRVVAYAECGSRYAVAEIARGVATARGRRIGYIECGEEIYMIKLVAVGRKKEKG
ncbi:MAG: hypothetical protein QXI64_10385 [Sulfolobales archaeon]